MYLVENVMPIETMMRDTLCFNLQEINKNVFSKIFIFFKFEF